MFVTNNYKFNMLSQGYLEDKKLEPILRYLWLKMPGKPANLRSLINTLINTFTDTNFVKKLPVKFIAIQEVEQLQKKKPKKVLDNIGADFCNTCRIMNKTTYL